MGDPNRQMAQFTPQLVLVSGFLASQSPSRSQTREAVSWRRHTQGSHNFLVVLITCHKKGFVL